MRLRAPLVAEAGVTPAIRGPRKLGPPPFGSALATRRQIAGDDCLTRPGASGQRPGYLGRKNFSSALAASTSSGKASV